MKALALLFCISAVLPAAGAETGLHAGWDAVLKTHSRNERVDYGALKRNPASLDAYLRELAAVSKKDESAWPREKRLAFWINAYNAFTVKAIVDHYPIRRGFGWAALRYPENSIRQIPGVWDGLKWKAAGREVTLDQIEHGILRKELKEPRIHFAVVCASLGCPPLRGEAYRTRDAETQLDDNVRRFVRSHRFVLDRKAGRLALSPILKWFGEDFARFDDGAWERYPEAFRGPLGFLARYLSAEDAAALKTRTFEAGWLPYDWSLNDLTVLPAR